MITTLDATDMPPTATDVELTLGGIETIEQVFMITRPDLLGLSIRLRPAAQSPADLRIPMRLSYADSPAADLISDSLLVQSAKDGVLTIRFPLLAVASDPRVPTTTLKLTLAIPALPPGTGPTITTRINPQRQGAISIDGRAEPNQDLLITPIYQRRWADQIWPISAMARGKPGLLGWPPFYLLLAYIYLLALGAGAVSIRRVVLANDG
jgi:hypothetical protein